MAAKNFAFVDDIFVELLAMATIARDSRMCKNWSKNRFLKMHSHGLTYYEQNVLHVIYRKIFSKNRLNQPCCGADA